MKKLYTLLAVAAVTLSASALELQRSTLSDTKFAQNGGFLAKEATARINAAKEYSAAPRSRAALALQGDSFMFLSFGENDDNSTYMMNDAVTFTKGLGNTYSLKNLLGNMVGSPLAVKCTITTETYTSDEGSVDYLLLTIPSKTAIYTGYNLYLFAYDNGQPTLYSNDLTFFSFDGKNFTFDYKECGIAFINKDYRGSWVLDPSFVASNGSFTTNAAYSDNSGNIAFEEINGAVYAEYSSSKLLVCNFGGFSRPVIFDVNVDAKTVTANNQVCEEYYTGTSYEVAYLSSASSTIEPVEGTIEVADGKTFVKFEGPYFATIVGLGWGDAQMGTIVTIDEDLFNTDAISNVVADENAPVEYFNLQGVRVANPENGLYIRRQGNKAEKVLVK